MNILDAADILKDLATCIAVQKDISIQEAYQEAIEELKEAKNEYKEFSI